MSRVLSALRRGGSVATMARESKMDPELVRLAIDHRERLLAGSTKVGRSGGEAPAPDGSMAAGVTTGLGDPAGASCSHACPALHPTEVLPVGCAGCPLMSVRRA